MSAGDWGSIAFLAEMGVFAIAVLIRSIAYAYNVKREWEFQDSDDEGAPEVEGGE